MVRALLAAALADPWDSTYPGVELLPDDTIVTTTCGHWSKGEPPYVVSIRLKVAELDAMAKKLPLP